MPVHRINLVLHIFAAPILRLNTILDAMKKSWQVFWHIFFWLSLLLFFMFIVHNNSRMSINELLVIFIIYGVINISLFYLNFLIFIPQFLDKRKFKTFAIAIVVTIVAYGIGKYFVGLGFRQYVLTSRNGHAMTFGAYFLSTVFSSLVFVFLSIVLKFSVDWFVNERVQRDLENQRLSAELAFLKSQINPHFLFNSLNSIYSLAYQRSDTTPEAILKLSEIMRYMLYESNDNKVDLAKELQYLQNYIELQKIRFGKKAYVDYVVNGAVTNQRIVPLLLISFIENAFKHGVANDPNFPIMLTININANRLDFYMQNKKHQHNRDASGGIGLQNVKRRLDLLYEGKYKLNINDQPETYSCDLTLIL
jgi:sensor histidine kinase YesM